MSDSQNWVEKHRPDDWDSIQGNNSAIDDIREWLEEWESGDPPQLLVGAPGTGKTTTARVAAEELDKPIHEVDTSTARKSAQIARFADEMRGGDKVVLLDEVDSWPASANLSPLNDALRDPDNPVFMTANEEYDVPQAVKGPADIHEFKLNTSSRRAKLKDIAKAEGVPLDEHDLERLVERPDLRSAINDLQIHAETGVPIGEDKRDWDESEFSAMDAIIQHQDTDVDIRPPWLVMWLDQNVRKEYRGLELAAAYDALSRADRYLGDAGAGDYRGWRFAGLLAEEVANLRLTEPYTGWVKWEFPSWVQSTVPDHEDDDPQAELYRALDVSTGYVEFRETVLPILRRLPAAERLQLVKDEGLTQDAASALGVSEGAYDDAMVQAEPERGESLDKPTGNALEGDW